MAAVGRGSLRPGNPSKHSFFVIALVIIVIFLGFSLWSASVKNTRLVAEYNKLKKSFKVSLGSDTQPVA